jgi:hypothetical protein
MDSGQDVAETDEDQTEATDINRGSSQDDDGSVRKPTRLSVNISRDTFDALQEIASDKDITITEAVRRLIGYGIIVYRANRDGYEILLRRDGKLEKILLVD